MSDLKRIITPFSYSAAVQAGDYVFLGLHRGFGDTFAQQLDGSLAGIADTLGRLGLDLERLVKVHVWLKHIADLPEMEKRFALHFPEGAYPARMTSTTEFIDADCLVMVEGVAYRGPVTCPTLEELLAQVDELNRHSEECSLPLAGEEP